MSLLMMRRWKLRALWSIVARFGLLPLSGILSSDLKLYKRFQNDRETKGEPLPRELRQLTDTTRPPQPLTQMEAVREHAEPGELGVGYKQIGLSEELRSQFVKIDKLC